MTGWTIVAAIAALISSLAALWGVGVAVGTLGQLRKDSMNSARPYVGAQLVRPPFTRGTQYLILRNYGKSEARNLTVTFDPPLPHPDPQSGFPSVTPPLKRRYSQPIPVLLPDQELSNVWFLGVPGPDSKFVNAEPLPDKFTVTLSYLGPEATGEPFTAAFPLDVGIIHTESSVEPSDHPHRIAKDALQELKKLVSEVDELTNVISDGTVHDAPPSED